LKILAKQMLSPVAKTWSDSYLCQIKS
jgi:hypothetical protein